MTQETTSERKARHEEEKVNKFYLVWVEGRPGPTLKHGTIVDAVEEAERLLRLGDNKYRDVYILEPIMRGCLPEAPVEWESI